MYRCLWAPSDYGQTQGRGKERFVVVGLAFHLVSHLPQIAGGRLLGDTLGRLEPVMKLERVFEVQKNLDIAVPVVLRGDGLKQHLAEANRRRRQAAQSHDQGLEVETFSSSGRVSKCEYGGGGK